MITKKKTSIKYSVVYLFVFPLVCLILFAFTQTNYKPNLQLKTEVAVSGDEYVPSIYPIDLKKVKRMSGYENRRNPVTKENKFHYGNDFVLQQGEKVMSTAKGIVTKAEYISKYGNSIMIKHNEMYSTFYCHLKSFAVKAGDNLEKGQIIAYVGSTGLSTKPHLHYEVHKNGERVNPKDYLPK